MAGETAVETPVVAPPADNKIEDVVKSDKEAIVEEENEAKLAEEKKDEEKKEEKEKSPAKEKVEKPKRFPVHKQDFEKDVVYLYSFPRTPQVPVVSAFCLKLESWLKLHNIKYENVDHKMKMRSKKGLLPFVELNGEEINDSNHIIEVLSEKFEKKMPMELSSEQKNIQHAMLTMIENHLHWAVTQWSARDINNMLKGYKMDLAAAFGTKLPTALLNFYFKHTFLRKMMKKIKAQGLASSSNEEMEAMGKEDLDVLSNMLGDKQFLFGDEPAHLDLVAFGTLAPVVFVEKDVACPLRDHMEEKCQNLVGLVNRIKDRCWSDDWEKATGEEMDLNPHIPKPVVEEPVKEEEKKEEKEEAKEEGEKKEESSEKEAEKKEEEKETADEKKEEKEEKSKESKESDNKEKEKEKDTEKKEEKK